MNNSLEYKIFSFCSEPTTVLFAYERLAMHLRAAELQVGRIKQAIDFVNSNPIPKPPPSPASNTNSYVEQNRRLYDTVFIEVHFYFVSWVNCQNMMNTISSFPEFQELRELYHSIRKHFDSYSEARNSFEHFNDRLPSGKHHSRIKELQENDAGPRKVYRGLKGGNYTFSNREWDITPKSFQLLKDCVNEFGGKFHSLVDSSGEATA